jgi:hypothetical protein
MTVFFVRWPIDVEGDVADRHLTCPTLRRRLGVVRWSRQGDRRTHRTQTALPGLRVMGRLAGGDKCLVNPGP